MRKIYGIGETVLDIIFKNSQPQKATAGGAMLNSTVSLGRLGLPVYFISEYAGDNVGKMIDAFLSANGVDTKYVDHYKDGKTKLALAFLDEGNDASYTFYQDYPVKRLSVDFPIIMRDDIVLFGSIYSVTVEIRKKLIDLIIKAKDDGALVIYDPNFRSSYSTDLVSLKPRIIENIRAANLIRGSDEDFKNIWSADTPDEAWAAVKNYCNCMVYTANSRGVYVRTVSYSGKFDGKVITPVSTIGAGDNFNAGMMAAIYLNKFSANQLDTMGEKEWSKVISMGIDFATNVCMSYENYIDLAFARRYFSASSDQI
jgi:fructokinase